MDALNGREELVREHADGLHAELAATEHEQLLQTGPEQVHDQLVIVAVGALLEHVGHPGHVGLPEPVLDPVLDAQLRVLILAPGFQLDSHFCFGKHMVG